MKLDFDIHNPKEVAVLVGLAIVASGLYWIIWRRNARLANWIVFAAVVALLTQTVNWDYWLNSDFRVRWKLP